MVEWIVCMIKVMYEKSATVIRYNGRESEEFSFSIKVGVHQGFVLNLLLFIIVLGELSKSLREGLPRKLLYPETWS